MIGWYTDNSISHVVLSSIPSLKLRHISEFDSTPVEPSVFYGILRGTARAMHIMKYMGIPFHYIDNGYTDAEYVNHKNIKQLTGKYRVCQNDMMTPYAGATLDIPIEPENKTALFVMPSTYAADYYGYVPNDWARPIAVALERDGYKIIVREKGSKIDFMEQLNVCDLLVSFNSMAVMAALSCGVPAYDQFGILRNIGEIKPGFIPTIKANHRDVVDFYNDKQFTLEEIRCAFI